MRACLSKFCGVFLASIVLGVAASVAYAQERPRVSASVVSNQIALTTSEHPGMVLTLQTSTNMAAWDAAGVFHDALLRYPDLRAPAAARFYRVLSSPKGKADDWKNQIVYPFDPFRRPAMGPNDLEWIKFVILPGEPSRVFYQDSEAFPFHYEFATQRLTQFKGMSRAAFDAATLYSTNRQAILGAVLLAPPNGIVEYGIQFVGLDAFAPEEIARWFSLVKATVFSSNSVASFYLPTFEQSEMARTNRAALEGLGVPVSSVERWLTGDHVYAAGWAVGTLKFFPASEIPAAYADGRLKPGDLLLTDGVPAETPLVAGIISLRPSTPNSHTAILSRAFGIPFVYFTDSLDQAYVQSLVGRRVVLRAEQRSFTGASAVVFDAQDTLANDQVSELLALKKAPPIAYSPKRVRGAFSQTTDTLTPADIQYFGGKAANYGFLRRYLPTNSPAAIAFSFDLWDAFIKQPLAGTGSTLEQEISRLLAPFTNYPPDVAALSVALEQVRELITDDAAFNAEQRQAITNALTVFQPHRKIRFRSSTNVEDSESFTGAGLYDSYSGCLLDDMDGDSSGPSQCDPTEARERGVFRAIQRVYASFYNQNAFLERLRHGVKESEVGMGVLVHHSFPDDDELANGVATITYNLAPNWHQARGEMVTQLGAESVTNPDGSSTPEVVAFESFGSSSFVTLTRYSSRMPLGGHVMEWEREYRQFGELFAKVAEAYRAYFPSKTTVTLDFEYKKDRHLGLVVKQVRTIPELNSSTPTNRFLLNQPREWVVAQAEFGDVFANHRLKSVLQLSTHSMWLVDSNLVKGMFSTGRVDYLEGTNVLSITGAMTNWPQAERTPRGETNAWSTGPSTNARRWELLVNREDYLLPDSPVITLGDMSATLRVTYERPVPTYTVFDGASQTTEEMVRLEPRPTTNAAAIRVARSFATNGVEIATSFYWPRPPRGIAAGYTAPLVTFEQTRITGLTPEPILLTGYYSQTYRPGHHNFTEYFVFEPQLDPGLPAATRAELDRAGIKLIYLQLGGDDAALVLGVDGKFRPL